jgi:hypothetical protein
MEGGARSSIAGHPGESFFAMAYLPFVICLFWRRWAKRGAQGARSANLKKSKKFFRMKKE